MDRRPREEELCLGVKATAFNSDCCNLERENNCRERNIWVSGGGSSSSLWFLKDVLVLTQSPVGLWTHSHRLTTEQRGVCGHSRGTKVQPQGSPACHHSCTSNIPETTVNARNGSRSDPWAGERDPVFFRTEGRASTGHKGPTITAPRGPRQRAVQGGPARVQKWTGSARMVTEAQDQDCCHHPRLSWPTAPPGFLGPFLEVRYKKEMGEAHSSTMPRTVLPT